jgi:hypothetical protein
MALAAETGVGLIKAESPINVTTLKKFLRANSYTLGLWTHRIFMGNFKILSSRIFRACR